VVAGYWMPIPITDYRLPITTLLKKAYLNRQDAKFAKKTKEYISNFNQFAPFYKVYSFAHKKSWRPWRLGGFFRGVNYQLPITLYRSLIIYREHYAILFHSSWTVGK
jgi:hypothetical protein